MKRREENEERPNPDQLLTVIQKDARRTGKGHFKIFLGMVAGVGKTYAMLQRAHQLRSQGIDAVVGWVDTHGRSETAKLIEGLEVIPRRSVAHRNVILEEMDTDALLKRRPKVALVDELAHTNAPGGRHSKRYQDVLELLNAGIDVFTTVNIQHLESRVDTVKEITGISIHETVPDSILDEADEIVLIDLPPEDLLERLKEGRIYPTERAEVAGRNFFQKGNLTALRELALRAATERVDRELRDFKTLHGIEEAWKSSSRLMVAVFASPYSESLIRWTRRLADTMGATWVGGYVELGSPLSDEEKHLLEKNTQLVRQLGGEFTAIQDQDLVDGLLRIARQNNVTQIIVGKTQRSLFKNLLSGGSVVHRLLRKSGDIDIYAVATEKTAPSQHKKVAKHKLPIVFPWGEMGWIIALVLLFWFVAAGAEPLIGYQAVGILFLMAVLVSGLWLSRLSVFVTAVLLSVIHNFFFIPPLYTFTISRPEDVLMHTMLFLAATSIGHLTTRLRRQNLIIRTREDRAVQLYNLAHAISEAQTRNAVVRAGVEAFYRIFRADAAIILFSPEGKPLTEDGSTFFPDPKEIALAEWAKQNVAIAGKFTETLPSSEATYLPLQSKKVVVGVLGLRLPKEARFDYEERNFAQALAGQLASGLERERLHDARQRLEVLEQAERLYRSLFDSVSHELKTPLTTIKGATSSLLGGEGNTPEHVGDMASQIIDEADRLLKVVDNMLDMTRLESGAIKPNLKTVDLADVLGPALKRVEKFRGNRRVETRISPDLSPLLCDPALSAQALGNILSNAALYTPDRGTIEISAKNRNDGAVEITVRDSGPGLPTENPSIVLEKFFRARPEKSGGLGLGLSIARGFIEAQGGTLNATNHPAGGAEFTITLPSG